MASETHFNWNYSIPPPAFVSLPSSYFWRVTFRDRIVIHSLKSSQSIESSTVKMSSDDTF